MATISRFSAVASIGRLRFSGFFAWVLWLAIHLVYIIGFKHRVTTLLHWSSASSAAAGPSGSPPSSRSSAGWPSTRCPRTRCPTLPGDPADGHVDGVAELEDRRRTTA